MPTHGPQTGSSIRTPPSTSWRYTPASAIATRIWREPGRGRGRHALVHLRPPSREHRARQRQVERTPSSPTSRCRPARSACRPPPRPARRCRGSAASRPAARARPGRSRRGRRTPRRRRARARRSRPRAAGAAATRACSSSGGNTAAVAPSSAIMLAIVPRSGTLRSAVPGPVNSKTLFLPPLHAQAPQQLEDHVLGLDPGPVERVRRGAPRRPPGTRSRRGSRAIATATSRPAGADRDHARARRWWWCASRRPPGCRPAARSARCARSGRCRCRGASSGSRSARQSAWSMRWSSGFLKSSWMTLWSTYWTARSTLTRGTSSCSNCISAIVPVASWSSVWSTRSEIAAPGRQLAVDEVLAQDLAGEVLRH